MKKMKALCLLLAFFFTSVGKSETFRIYNIAREIPLTSEQKTRKKNFYLNFGQQQGVQTGTEVNVLRVISTTDPYDGKKRVNYKVKVAKLKVLHAQENASIATLQRVYDGASSPYFDIPSPMIGDLVEVDVD